MSTRKSNSNVNKQAKVSANSKKDFANLMKNTKAEIHKLGFVSNVIATNCSIGFFEDVAEGAGIQLSDRTKERLVNITKSKDTVKIAVISYYQRIEDKDGNITVITPRTYDVNDTFYPENNNTNKKVLEKAIRYSDGITVLQKGYTKKALNLFTMDSDDEKILVMKTAKSSSDGNIVTTKKVFHRKEKFSIDEAAVAVIAYAQSDVELILD